MPHPGHPALMFGTDIRMKLDFMTADVFTDRQFGGNPLAVVLNGQGLATEQMQSIAAEFNLAETTFVLPPRDPRHTAEETQAKHLRQHQAKTLHRNRRVI